MDIVWIWIFGKARKNSFFVVSPFSCIAAYLQKKNFGAFPLDGYGIWIFIWDIDIGDRYIKGITSRENMDMEYGGGKK